MAEEVNCPYDGQLIDVAVPGSRTVQATAKEYGNLPYVDRRDDRYLEVGCKECDESFWVSYRK